MTLDQYLTKAQMKGFTRKENEAFSHRIFLRMSYQFAQRYIAKTAAEISSDKKQLHQYIDNLENVLAGFNTALCLAKDNHEKKLIATTISKMAAHNQESLFAYVWVLTGNDPSQESADGTDKILAAKLPTTEETKNTVESMAKMLELSPELIPEYVQLLERVKKESQSGAVARVAGATANVACNHPDSIRGYLRSISSIENAAVVWGACNAIEELKPKTDLTGYLTNFKEKLPILENFANAMDNESIAANTAYVAFNWSNKRIRLNKGFGQLMGHEKQLKLLLEHCSDTVGTAVAAGAAHVAFASPLATGRYIELANAIKFSDKAQLQNFAHTMMTVSDYSPDCVIKTLGLINDYNLRHRNRELFGGIRDIARNVPKEMDACIDATKGLDTELVPFVLSAAKISEKYPEHFGRAIKTAGLYELGDREWAMRFMESALVETPHRADYLFNQMEELDVGGVSIFLTNYSNIVKGIALAGCYGISLADLLSWYSDEDNVGGDLLARVELMIKESHRPNPRFDLRGGPVGV